MKIAIHHRPGSFSERWMQYCKKQGLSYKEVNCYDSNIIEKISDCDALLWHHSESNYKDVLFAKQLLYSVQKAGKVVFPDYNTGWHFDDKVGQKYLLEAIKAPFVPSYVFYTKKEALNWINLTSFPKVFKLRGGASSSNVKLVRTRKEAVKLVRKAFNCGFPKFNRVRNLKERIRLYNEGKSSVSSIFKGLAKLFINTENSKMQCKEKGYIYFQDFIINNNHDIRIIVIGKRAFGIKRLNRSNDFRASGSGKILYDKNQIPIDCIKISFELNNKINAQAIAFDYLINNDNKYVLTEISYGFVQTGYIECPGYWDDNLNWHERDFIPEYFIMQDVVKSILNTKYKGKKL